MSGMSKAQVGMMSSRQPPDIRTPGFSKIEMSSIVDDWDSYLGYFAQVRTNNSRC